MNDQQELIPSDVLQAQFDRLSAETQDAWLDVQWRKREERIMGVAQLEISALRRGQDVTNTRVDQLAEKLEESARIKKKHIDHHREWCNRTELGVFLPGAPAWTRTTMLLQCAGLLTRSVHTPWTAKKYNEAVRPKSDPVIQNHIVIRDYTDHEFEEPVWEIDTKWVIGRINEWLGSHDLLLQYNNAGRSQKTMHGFIDRLWEVYGKLGEGAA